jgi:hypothetical protein
MYTYNGWERCRTTFVPRVLSKRNISTEEKKRQTRKRVHDENLKIDIGTKKSSAPNGTPPVTTTSLLGPNSGKHPPLYYYN